MSQGSPIQWCDDTVNGVMGCGAPCELRPTPSKVCAVTQAFFQRELPDVSPAHLASMVKDLLADHNATAIDQLRQVIVDGVMAALGREPGSAITEAMTKRLKNAYDEVFICYAHQQHLFRGTDITNPDKRANPGYAPQFEKVTRFPGRIAGAAARPDLYGKPHPGKPWLAYLPRMIFVSDMGDALSPEVDFDYLKRELIDVVVTRRGSQHLWLWLSKMPKRMAEFGEWLLGQGITWPDNLVAMTTVTSSQTAVRVSQLKAVPARFKTLSVEPLWEEVSLPLDGIDWTIVGGQSGPGSKSFDVAWIESLVEQRKNSRTALFVKQLGALPVAGGDVLALKDPHGGDWNEWPAHLRIREIPADFRCLRNSAPR
jgi:protein gp37